MKVLEGKTAVITGSSRGLGLAIARAFAENGANVVLAARNKETLDLAVAQLKNDGYPVAGFICDASNYQQVEALAKGAVSAFGKIDIWVNNAGVSAPYGPTISISPKSFSRVIDTNINGVYIGSFVGMQYFLAQGSGKLINMLGRGADGPVPFQNAYASSKTWVKTFTLALAKENAHSGVQVMAFNPGMMLTEMLTQVDVVPGFEEKVQPLNTVMRLWAKPPEEPAKKIVWLASSATDGKTGLNVNFMTTRLMLGGVLKELWRKLRGKTSSIPTIEVHVSD
jgi:NAD(P)-dependent dehydrogenase (short-subunit alcohol dehydrogenase family)